MSVELLRHYPQLVRSCAISGSAVSGYARWERALICGQAPLWTTRWHWAAQARAFGIGEEEKELFVLTTSSPSRETNMPPGQRSRLWDHTQKAHENVRL